MPHTPANTVDYLEPLERLARQAVEFRSSIKCPTPAEENYFTARARSTAWQHFRGRSAQKDYNRGITRWEQADTSTEAARSRSVME